MNKAVTLTCPVCGESWTEPSLDEFLETIQKSWDMWRPLPDDVEAKLKEYNDPEHLKKILSEKGYLSVFCHDCATAATAVACECVSPRLGFNGSQSSRDECEK